MRQHLARLKIDAMLSRGDTSPIPVAIITQTYMIAKPLLDKVKAGTATHPDMVALYELYTIASFICDHMQRVTVDSAKELLQKRKQAVFDGGAVLLEFMRADGRYKATGVKLGLIHDGYIAACEVFENGTVAAYKAAKAEIQELEFVGKQRAKRKGGKR